MFERIEARDMTYDEMQTIVISCIVSYFRINCMESSSLYKEKDSNTNVLFLLRSEKLEYVEE